MERDERLEHDVGEWLGEGPPPDPNPSFDDLIEAEPIRQVRGDPDWWEQDVPEDEELITEHPATAKRRRDRAFSERWGWIWDLASALYWWFRSWFTTDIVLGLFRASYALIMVALLFGIFYSVYIAGNVRPRRLPTIEELMKPSQSEGEKEGSPNPTEGKP